MGGVAFIPGVGWVISGVYFIANTAIKSTTGESIGDHIDDFSKNLDFTSQMDMSDFNLIGGHD